jgi:nucleoside-diphosphate-sugar epimerase
LRALVTGASGFIGAHVVAELAAGGAEVRAFDRDVGGSTSTYPSPRTARREVPHHMRARALAAIGCVAALLLTAGPASAAAFKATLKAPNHSPRAGAKDWRITVTATSSSGRPVRAQAVYKFLYNGQVVSTQNPWPGHSTGGRSPFHFTGRYSDDILWPARSGGYPLTLRVVVSVAGKGSINLDWKVRVVR